MAAAEFGSRTGLRLTLAAAGPLKHAEKGMPTWRAVLTGPGLHVETQFAEAGWEPRSLADFVGDIARDWRGWDGDRSWQSGEAELRLKARHNRTNTVLISVEIEDGAPPRWRCEAELEFDPGAFQQLADDLRELSAPSTS